jgi:hypothetical protein
VGALVGTVLVASLLGSVHCAAMCGAFACFAAGSAPGRAARHLPYHLGRLVSYLLLGVIAGTVGTGLNRAGRLAGIGDAAVVVMALLLIGWGVHTMLATIGPRRVLVRVPAWWQRRVGALLAHLEGASATLRGTATGLLTGLLPCGWLWAFVAVASGTADPLRGATVMAVFWLGSVPALMLAAAGLARLTGRWQRRLPLVSAAMVVVLGLVSLAGHLDLIPVGHWLHRVMPSPEPIAGAMSHG